MGSKKDFKYPEKIQTMKEPPREIIMQKLGERWYVFGVFKGECFYTRLDNEAFKEPIPRSKDTVH